MVYIYQLKKQQRFSEWETRRPNYILSIRNLLQIKRQRQDKSKERERDIPCQHQSKESGVAILIAVLISDKADIMTKTDIK